MASTNTDGYGRFRAHGRKVGAHRFSLELEGIDIPSGMYVLHTCDNPACVNPDHLYLGDQVQNMVDRTERCDHPMTKLSAKDIPVIRRMAKSGMSHQKISGHFNVQRRQISRIVSGEMWSHVN